MLLLSRPALAVGALALSLLPPLADQVGFHPAEGSEATKTFKIEGSFDLGDVSIIVDGQDMSGQLPLGEASGTLGMSMEIVDHYLKTADGKPLHLERSYNKSSSSFAMAEQSESDEDLFELDGETVVFKWNEEKGSYERSFKDGEGKADKLEGLGIDLDYRALLPGKDVAAGDKWEVAPEGLVSALFLGADMSQMADLSEADPEIMEMADKVLPALEKLFDGFKAQCEYVGSREAEGLRLGEIKMTVDSDGSIDLRDAILDLINSQTEGQGVEIDMQTAQLALKIRGEGRLLWDLAAGRAHSFQMDSSVEFLMEMEMSVAAPDGTDHSAEMNAEILGTAKWTMD